MLCPFLIASPSLNQFRPFLQRNGSAVTHLSFSCGIVFVDACKMISPGVSLSKFADSMGLETPKPLLPYNLLDEEETFLECKELPADPKAYYSELSNTTPTVEMVNEARDNFSKLNCSTVKDYLAHYLKIDVILLACSITIFFDHLEETMGLHPLACFKLTLPSYADLLAQRHLMEHKRVGCFSPTHWKIFAMIRRSIIGGSSTTCRTAVVEGDTGTSPCNYHLRDDKVLIDSYDEDERGREHEDVAYVCYLDVNSLYCSSGEYISNYINYHYQSIKRIVVCNFFFFRANTKKIRQSIIALFLISLSLSLSLSLKT